MRRGHRKLWRDVAQAAQEVATSKNYAEEYMAGIEFTRAMTALLREAGADRPSQIPVTPTVVPGAPPTEPKPTPHTASSEQRSTASNHSSSTKNRTKS